MASMASSMRTPMGLSVALAFLRRSSHRWPSGIQNTPSEVYSSRSSRTDLLRCLVRHEVVGVRVVDKRGEFVAPLREDVGDVLEEDEAEDDVLVVGGVHLAAQFGGCRPECCFETLRPVLLLRRHCYPLPLVIDPAEWFIGRADALVHLTVYRRPDISQAEMAHLWLGGLPEGWSVAAYSSAVPGRL